MSTKFQATGIFKSSKGKENQHQFSSPFQIFLPASFLSYVISRCWWSVAKMKALQGRGESTTAITLHELRHWTHQLFKMPEPHWHPAWKTECTPNTVLLAAAAAAVQPISYSKYSLGCGENTMMLLGYLYLLIFSFSFSALQDTIWYHENN